jgi:hypothetical protein
MSKKAKAKCSVSQSLIKKLWEYAEGKECGKAVRDIDILRLYEREPSEPMLLGQYFEYIATGQVNRDGSTPEPIKTSRGQLTADSKRADAQAENFNKMLKEKGIEILETGTVIVYEDMKIVLDALVKTPDYEEAIMDLKFTGLLGDKWHEMGWTEETYQYRNGLKIQPLFYKFVYELARGVKDIPFIYALHSSKNDTVYDTWEVNIVGYEERMAEVAAEVNNTRQLIKLAEAGESAFVPIPEMVRCSKCPVFSDCMFREVVPSTKSVTIFSLKQDK